MLSNNLIALDADGVLVDYNRGYACAWEQAFGVKPIEINPQAYWAVDRFDVTRLDFAGRARLRAAMDETYWGTLSALPGALAACVSLKAQGYRLVCVSAIEAKNQPARMRNLVALGFPIEDVIATGGEPVGGLSPKAAVIQQLAPIAFVDDFAPYLNGLAGGPTHLALILRELEGSPNQGAALTLADSTHHNLEAFAAWWKTRPNF